MEDFGFRVDAVADGSSAIAAIGNRDYILMVADVQTPGFSPMDFLKEARFRSPEARILFLADHPLVEEAVALMKAGAHDFIVKPINSSQLELFAKGALVRKTSRKNKGKSAARRPVSIITRDGEMKRLLALAAKVADSTASVLIQGESGTGKELFARFLHEQSRRKGMPFVAVNCAALPENLLESELFGHEKGAFTGAVSRKIGKFEAAHGGTLFLDEITEMQIHLQAKLLRVLQEKMVDRVGGSDPVPVDVRVVATTNRKVRETIEKGEFREDLFYRLNTIPLLIPPLRHRRGDLSLLVEHFVEKYNKIDTRNVKGVTADTLALLGRHVFSGNVRELENIIHRAVLLAEGEMITPGDLLLEESSAVVEEGGAAPGFPHEMEPAPLKKMEEQMIFHTLDHTEGNRTHAAKLLGISVRTLRNKLNEYKQHQPAT